MIHITSDPFPDDDAMRRLWQTSWGDAGPHSFQPVLRHALGHVGAHANGVLIGFVNVAWDGGIHAFILDTCVDGAYQRRGIAVRLVRQAASLAKARGAQWLHVDFEPHLAGFYARCGFGATAAGLMRLG